MKFIYLSILSLFITSGFSSAVADSKIGVVDQQRVFLGSKVGMRIKSEMETAFNKKRDEFQKKEANLKKMHDDLNKQSLALSQKAKEDKQKKLQAEYMGLQQEMANADAEIREKQKQLTKPIENLIDSAISELANKEGYEFVFDKSIDKNVVLFSPAKVDLTAKVIELIDKKDSSGSAAQGR